MIDFGQYVDREIITLRNLFLDCNTIMRVARDPHTLYATKQNLQSVFTNPTYSKSGADLLASFGIQNGDRVDDDIFEMMFSDPSQKLLKWIASELHIVMNMNYYKRSRTVASTSDADATSEELVIGNGANKRRKTRINDAHSMMTF